MAEINRPDMTNLWASDGAVIAPSGSKIQQGWTAEIPPHQWENFVQNRQDEALAYLMQKGVPEWDASTEYQVGRSFVQFNGVIYKSKTLNTNKQPDVSPTDWENYADSLGVTGKAEKSTTITAGNGLSGGGDLSANRTLNVTYGTTVGTSVQGNSIVQVVGTSTSNIMSQKAVTDNFPRILTYAQAITQATDIGPILVIGMDGVWEWTTSTFFTGYRHPRCGHWEDGWTKTPLAFQLEAIGANWSEADPKQARVISVYREQTLTIASGSWIAGQNMISDLGGGLWKSPDLRNMFKRASGTDADTANARTVGSWQIDQFRSHRHGIGENYTNGSGISNALNPAPNNVMFSTYEGGAETRGVNTAVAPYIHV